MSGDGSRVSTLVISVSALTERERANLRCTTLLAKSKLSAAWRISDIDSESHCRFVVPENGCREGHIEFSSPADRSTVLVEVDWPLTEASLVRALNMTSDRLGGSDTAINPRTSWINSLRRRATPKPRPATDHREGVRSIGSYLRRFGLIASTPTINILFAGPPGSGKTTAITTASTIPSRTTEAAATDDVGTLKSRTTISIDYGECELGGYRLRMFGTPGQLRFAYMINQTLASCDAVILLADLSSPNPLEDVQRYAALIATHIEQGRPVMVGLTHVDTGQLPKHFHRDLCEALGRRVPTVPLDPRNPASMRRALQVLTGAARTSSSQEAVVA